MGLVYPYIKFWATPSLARGGPWISAFAVNCEEIHVSSSHILSCAWVGIPHSLGKRRGVHSLLGDLLFVQDLSRNVWRVDISGDRRVLGLGRSYASSDRRICWVNSLLLTRITIGRGAG